VSDQPPYVMGAAFRRAARAKAIFHQVEALLRDQPVDLSAYNLFLNGQPLVIVLGYPPPPQANEAIGRILSCRVLGACVTMNRAKCSRWRRSETWKEGR
jgi:hypothetical protein